jgi:flagellar hook-associated protein 3 FlgL
MRIDPNLVPTILADLQQSQVSLNTALQEVSTGKSVNVPSDNPSAAADMVQNTIETGDVDQYTQNVNSVLSTVQSASSVLNSVVTSLTQAVSLGTEGANGTNSTGNLQTLATQVQGILSTVVSAANTSVGGAYLFGGTSTATPYTADSTSPTGYTYNGNNDTNSVAVGDNLSVQVTSPAVRSSRTPATASSDLEFVGYRAAKRE